MRLVCPNCGAQYEIDDRVVPAAGRDVQCSSCGHAWFQKHPDRDADLADELGTVPPVSDPTPQADVQDDVAQDDVAQDATPDPVAEIYDDNYGDEYSEDRLDLGDTADQDDTPAPIPQGLDDGVRDILRQEAEREMEHRSHEQEQLESQPDLGLDATAEDDEDDRRARVKERMTRLRGLPEDEPEVEDGTGARRDLLPDIEEINSTLDASGDDVGNLPPDVTIGKRRGGGFRRGFLFMITLAALVVILYIMAPKLAEAVPALAPLLDGFISAVDKARMMLDGAAKSAIEAMQGTIAGGETAN